MRTAQVLYRIVAAAALAEFTFAANDIVPYNDSEVGQYENDEPERGLQTDTDGAICNFVEESFFQNKADCTCGLSLPKLGVEFECTTDPICSPIGSLCGVVAFSVAVGLRGVDAEVCIQDIALSFFLNIDIPGPFCINYTTQTFKSAMRRTCNKGIIDCFQTGKAAQAKQAVSLVDECTVTLGGEECNSCVTCNKKGSVQFDCTNIVEGFKSEKCVPFEVWTGPGSIVDPTKLPELTFAE